MERRFSPRTVAAIAVALVLTAIAVFFGLRSGVSPQEETVANAESTPAPVAEATDVAPSVETLPAQPELPLESIRFAYDSAELTSESGAGLDALASGLQAATDVRLSIEGHCDDRGTDAYNQKLSERRADAVKAALVARGVDAARLDTVGKGEKSPAAEGKGEGTWSQNRRVEFRKL